MDETCPKATPPAVNENTDAAWAPALKIPDGIKRIK